MLGVDYNHEDYGSFMLEGNLLVPHEGEDAARKRSLSAFYWNKKFWRDTLTLGLSIFSLQSIKNSLSRFFLEFEFSNNLKFFTQFTNIEVDINDPEFFYIKDFDRMDFGISYGFDLSQK